jgi:hypothetical protein
MSVRQDCGGALALAVAVAAVLGSATAVVAGFTVAAPRAEVLQVQQERLRDGLDTALAAAVENVRRDASACTARTVDLGDVEGHGAGRIRVVVSCADLGGGRHRFTATGYLAQPACAPSAAELSASPVLRADLTYVQAARDARAARVDRQTLDETANRCTPAPRQ